MVRGGRAEAQVSRSDVNFRLDQKTANFEVTKVSRPMQWSFLTEEKEKNQLAQTEFRLIKTTTTIRQLLAVFRLYISVAQQQKTDNFKAAFGSRPMQWSHLTEEKQKSKLSQPEFRFIKTIIM